MSLRLRVGEVEIAFQFWFFTVVLLFVLLGKEALALYIALPIIIHEAGHLLTICLCGAQLRRIVFTPVSVNLVRQEDTLGLAGEICIALGGVAANLLAAALLYRFAFQSMRMMLLIAANLAVALFNLLPIGSLDGGTVVRLLCERIFLPYAARNISRIMSLLVLAPLMGISIWLIWNRSGNFTLLLCCVYLSVTVILRE